jgi:hypothetical protein
LHDPDQGERLYRDSGDYKLISHSYAAITMNPINAETIEAFRHSPNGKWVNDDPAVDRTDKTSAAINPPTTLRARNTIVGLTFELYSSAQLITKANRTFGR